MKLLDETLGRPSKTTPLDTLPLCVDLDGTLVRTDTLLESAVAAFFDNWRTIFKMPGWLAGGKLRLKAELARRWRFNPATLPYNQDLLEYLRAQYAAGREIVLCTASHREIAERIAASLGLFSAVIATDDAGPNLRGSAKAAALCRRFGKGGFVYIGNEKDDHAVWREAAAAIVVNAPASLIRAAKSRYKVIAVIERPKGGWRAAAKAIRPQQWVKNLLCLVPPAVALDFSHGRSWTGAMAIAVAFCLVASSIYLINDISDLEADRAHPRKFRRPFASGALAVSRGIMLSPLLMICGLALGWASGAFIAIAVYGLSSLSYMWLKTRPLVDVFLLALLYTIRLVGGGEASGHPVSLWLLGFSSFLFLSLALIKRVSELYRLAETGGAAEVMRRGYYLGDLPVVQMFGCAATFASAIVLSLYVQNQTALAIYPHAAVLWAWVPLLLFWQCRLWLSTTRGFMHDDPIVYASRDWVSWITVGCLAAIGFLAWLPISL